MIVCHFFFCMGFHTMFLEILWKYLTSLRVAHNFMDKLILSPWTNSSLSTNKVILSHKQTHPFPWTLLSIRMTTMHIKHTKSNYSSNDIYLPLMSGGETKICLSNLPALSKALSSNSILLVAAKTTTFFIDMIPKMKTEK